MADNSLIIDAARDYSGVAGRHLVRDFWPGLEGSLFAAYMFGDAYAQYSRRPPEEKAYLAGMDWSGNGRHISLWGDMGLMISDYSLQAKVSADEVLTTFTLAELADANGEFSILCLASTVSTARTVALARTDTVVSDPSIALTLFPQSADVRAGATVSATSGNATITALTTELGNIALYGGSWTQSTRNVWSKTGTADTKTAQNTTPLGALTDDNYFELADEAGSGSGNTFIYGVAFYDRAILQAEFDAALLRQRTCHEAIESGLPV